MNVNIPDVLMKVIGTMVGKSPIENYPTHSCQHQRTKKRDRADEQA